MEFDATITGSAFDSFFFADGPIHESERLTAQTFGADGALYVTTGTTASNQIALRALTNHGARVLIDRHCHQSIHFSLELINAQVSHLFAAWTCPETHRSIWSLTDLLEKVRAADAAGCPFDLIVLNGSTYDGMVIDVPAVIEAVLATGTVTRCFLIDEAWGSADYFTTNTFVGCAMASRRLLTIYPTLEVVATQSLHKSLSCLRQASLILHLGGIDLAERLRVARFKIHSTSPSYPILASIDLARAQMVVEGADLVQQARALADQFRDRLRSDTALTFFSINDEDGFRKLNPFADFDQTKISINLAGLDLKADYVQSRILRKNLIYINRFTASSLLLNFHIGVDQHQIDITLDALRMLQREARRPDELVRDGSRFIVPYPPGIPIHHPGEPVTDELHRAIRHYEDNGIRVFAA
jgi:arginine/lysine/ornithine decarboxylase